MLELLDSRIMSKSEKAKDIGEGDAISRILSFDLDPWQEKVLKTEGNLCICTGRQVGKSTIIGIKAGKSAMESKKQILIIAATERQAYLLFEKVLSYIETNNKEFHEDIKKQAVKNIQSNLVLLEIAKTEEIKASEEKFKEALENIAKQSNKPIEEIEKLANEGNARNNIESEIILNEAYEFIYDNAKVSRQKPVPYVDFVKL